MNNFKNEREYRSLRANLKTKDLEKRFDTDYYVEGYATTFEPYLWYEQPDGKKIYESFTADCFKNADMSDVIMQFDHMGRVYARQSNGTLLVEVDNNGLFIAADLSKTEGGRQLYEEIKEGLITKMSWGFRLGEYAFDEKTSTLVHKSVKKIYDVSAVSIPANQDTSINARCYVDGEIDKALKESQERSKLALKIKIELGE